MPPTLSIVDRLPTRSKFFHLHPISVPSQRITNVFARSGFPSRTPIGLARYEHRRLRQHSESERRVHHSGNPKRGLAPLSLSQRPALRRIQNISQRRRPATRPLHIRHLSANRPA